jgi:hypothetical protein
VRNAVRTLSSNLEEISEEHAELTDTAVREAIHEVLHYAFVWGHALEEQPVTYAMFTLAGDQAIAAAVARFLGVAPRLADLDGLALGSARLDALQDITIVTAAGNTLDNFLGSADAPFAEQPLPGWRFVANQEYEE